MVVNNLKSIIDAKLLQRIIPVQTVVDTRHFEFVRCNPGFSHDQLNGVVCQSNRSKGIIASRNFVKSGPWKKYPGFFFTGWKAEDLVVQIGLNGCPFKSFRVEHYQGCLFIVIVCPSQKDFLFAIRIEIPNPDRGSPMQSLITTGVQLVRIIMFPEDLSLIIENSKTRIFNFPFFRNCVAVPCKKDGQADTNKNDSRQGYPQFVAGKFSSLIRRSHNFDHRDWWARIGTVPA